VLGMCLLFLYAGSSADLPFALVLRESDSPDSVLEMSCASVIEKPLGENPFSYPQTSSRHSKLSNENLADDYSITEYLIKRADGVLCGFRKSMFLPFSRRSHRQPHPG
jgi:hypothetical protein